MYNLYARFIVLHYKCCPCYGYTLSVTYQKGQQTITVDRYWHWLFKYNPTLINYRIRAISPYLNSLIVLLYILQIKMFSIEIRLFYKYFIFV